MRFFIALLFLSSSIASKAQLDSLVWEDVQRTYLLHLPNNYTESIEIPLVIAMHGGFGSASNIQSQSQLSVKADEENFIVVYPEGVKGGIFDIRTWNAGWCCGFSSDNNVDDVGFINILIDSLISKYAIDTNRIYATGMSNGGFMSYRLACELSNRIAAIAPVAASMSLSDCNPNRPIPVMDIHSYLDFNIPYDGGVGSGPSTHYNPPLDSIMNVWSSLNSCLLTNDTIVHNELYTQINWSDCNCNVEVQQFLTRDGGHSWAGGEATPLGDPASNILNANDLMWSFFENHSLDCQALSVTNNKNRSILKVYPNPTSDYINIDFSDASDVLNLRIFNIQGKVVSTFEFSNTINLESLDNGLYIIEIKTKQTSFWKRILKT